MTNTSRTLTGIIALLSLAAFCPTPAKAESAPVLISQLRGHEVYAKESQLNPDRYHVGRVRGISGNVLYIEFPQPVAVGDREVKVINISATGTVARRVIGASSSEANVVGYPAPGDDVGVVYEDGRWQVVQRYHPYWVSRLQLREVPEVQRSAFNWDPKPFGLPPLEQRSVVIEPAPAPEPVRGMW
ncbi:hypothetical protein [Gloeothece verrucosa]|uniref:Uncharacterized protein n=1 Tax=Gloeothece verrucosa (strain PCC 7822) TaxID=497965 RepID=E0UIB3_GLOV7|nr:hypothetical protein [Gloeothece verrucosa]ADN16881.1 conserved hypothetical protein [Gloeothece verrucosa PCC 7822]